MAHRNEDGLIELEQIEVGMMPWQHDFRREHITATEDGRFVLSSKGERLILESLEKFSEATKDIAELLSAITAAFESDQ